MLTANEVLQDKSISHSIDLVGYSNQVVGKIIALLNRADIDLVKQLEIELEKLPVNQFNIDRINQLLTSVRYLNQSTYANVSTELDSQLQALTAYELDYQQRVLSGVLPEAVAIVSVNPQQVHAAAMARPFAGRLLKEWVSGLETAKANAVRDAVRIGYIESEPLSKIVQRVRGTKALNFKDGVLEISRRNAESIIRTAINHTSNYANQQLADANSELLKGYKYSAVLDYRTTVICASRSDKFYALGKPKPAIPAHIGCRSRYLPVLKSWRELGLDADEIPESTKASLDGQIPASTNYEKWLRGKSKEIQEQYLGVEKARLFRENKLSLEKFVSPKGHVYSISQLRVKYNL